MAALPADVTVTEILPGSAEGQAMLTAFFRDIVRRSSGREPTVREVDAEMRKDPSDDLRSPTGLFFVARQGAAVVGCIGLRLMPDGIGEVTRVYVDPAARGAGIGGVLMRTVEDEARDRELSMLRLDTRTELAEARRLYARHGFQPTAPFNDGWADLWFEKPLR